MSDGFGDFMIEEAVKLKAELSVALEKLADIRRVIESGEGSVSKIEKKIAEILQRVQP